ncbi:MAG TPA: endonuclease IV [Clostridiales bacterium]|nr:endonuclease IV [Clostridiales bacterium]
MIKFGPSGAPERFYDEGHKNTEEMPLWIKENGLDCFEYSFGRGVNLGEAKAKSIAEAFKKENIEISVHAPYFINLATPEETKAENSFNYILSSAVVGKIMGANRVVFHPAAQGKETRETAVNRTIARLIELKSIIEERGLTDIKFCPETMGKIAQIGTIEEVTHFCTLADFYYPTVDFGHVNAREQGSLKTKEDYLVRLNYMINILGYEKVNDMHVHFSKVEYTAKGEKRHLTFEDTVFGPDYKPFIESIVELNLHPYIVSESAGTQADDAKTMKDYYESLIK